VGPAETAGIVVITVAIIQGLVGLVRHLIDKNKEGRENSQVDEIQAAIQELKDRPFGLTSEEKTWFRVLYEMHVKYDSDGSPLWYVPRSWSETQKEIADKLSNVSETQNKTLVIIERLERRIEHSDQIGGHHGN